MSTADSQLLLGSAVAAGDLPLLRRFTYSVRTRSRIWLGRLLLVLIGVVSMAIALYKPDSILDLVAYAFGGWERPLVRASSWRCTGVGSTRGERWRG